ncbi:MAG: hypothetical protein ABR520_06780 [Mycobacteriales bacterium]|nr:hypothetical protein [Frankia sp.]
MRTRVAAAVAATLALLPIAQSHAGGPVLDGKKRTKIEWTGTMTPQQNVTTVMGYDPTTCTPADCAVKGFVFKPAKGVTGNILFAIKWTIPNEDVDLFIIDAKGGIVAQCAGFGGTGEALILPQDTLVAGKSYQAVAHYFLTAQDTVKGIVEFPTAETTNFKGVPQPDPTVGQVLCVLDGTIR